MKILKYLFIVIAPNILLAQQTWTLQECVNRAIEMNISIKQSKLDYAGSEI
jgi:outer membrane protein